MPFIQVDIATPLSGEQLAQLRRRIVDTVHASIGSARAHINVVIRAIPPDRIVEAGDVGPAARSTPGGVSGP